MEDENPPSSDFIKKRIWAGGADCITIDVEASLEENIAGYTVTLKPEGYALAQEKLIVNGVDVMSIGQLRSTGLTAQLERPAFT